MHFQRYSNGKYKYIFTCSEDMVKHVMGQYDDIDKRIRDIHHNAKVAYSDIIGMDMLAYKWCMDPTPDQQYAFSVAIIEINRRIVQLNVKKQHPDTMAHKNCPYTKKAWNEPRI